MIKSLSLFLTVGMLFSSLSPVYSKASQQLIEEITREYQSFKERTIAGLEQKPCKAVQFVYELQEKLQRTHDKHIAEKIAAIISEGAGVGGIDTERQATEDEKTILLGALGLAIHNKVILPKLDSDVPINSRNFSHQQYVYDIYRAVNSLNLALTTNYNFIENKEGYKNFRQRIENFFLREKENKSSPRAVSNNTATPLVASKEDILKKIVPIDFDKFMDSSIVEAIKIPTNRQEREAFAELKENLIKKHIMPANFEKAVNGFLSELTNKKIPQRVKAEISYGLFIIQSFKEIDELNTLSSSLEGQDQTDNRYNVSKIKSKLTYMGVDPSFKDIALVNAYLAISEYLQDEGVAAVPKIRLSDLNCSLEVAKEDNQKEISKFVENRILIEYSDGIVLPVNTFNYKRGNLTSEQLHQGGPNLEKMSKILTGRTAYSGLF